MNSIFEWTTQSGIHIVAVFLAFSFLIFVHELGHFLAALVTGVRVEKFMIGFDAWGLGLIRKIGNTEYGLGILPLGGYVKLAGASDMPGEEVCTGAPDELMSKGVWARGLIFIAGVVMNFGFGFLLLIAAQLYGIPVLPATLGYVSPGGPADEAGLLPGDTILKVGAEAIGHFNGLQQAVALSDGLTMPFTIQRNEGGVLVTKELKVTAAESLGRGRLYKIGVHPRLSREVRGFAEEAGMNLPGIETIKSLIHPGEEILAVDEHKIESDTEGGAINELVQARPGATVTLTIQPKEATQPERTITVPVLPFLPAGHYDIGLRYMVRIKTVLPGSAAERAGIKPDDYIGSIDGKRLIHTIDIIRLISGQAFQPTRFQVERDGQAISVEISPTVILPTEENKGQKRPSLLGIEVLTDSDSRYRIESVLPAGPSAGILRAGDILLGTTTLPFSTSREFDAQVAEASLRVLEITCIREGKENVLSMKPEWSVKELRPLIGIEFSQTEPLLYRVESGSIAEICGIGRQDSGFVMELSPDLKTTKLSWKRTGYSQPMTSTFATPDAVLANPGAHGIEGMLGVILDQHTVMEKALSLKAAASVAATGFVEKTMAIYLFLHKLVTGSVHPTAMGGPIIIIQTMYLSSEMGLGKLLDIMAFISINLAVLNLLPIPVLDGGHILFLIFEGIFRRKPSQKIREFAQYAGFVFLLGVMAMAFSFDIYYKWIDG